MTGAIGDIFPQAAGWNLSLQERAAGGEGQSRRFGGAQGELVFARQRPQDGRGGAPGQLFIAFDVDAGARRFAGLFPGPHAGAAKGVEKAQALAGLYDHPGGLELARGAGGGGVGLVVLRLAAQLV